jgi:hypothetical protein
MLTKGFGFRIGSRVQKPTVDPALFLALPGETKDTLKLYGDHFYIYGDVYEAIDACDHLALLLGRLKRRQLIGEHDWARSGESIADVRRLLEGKLPKPE